MIIILFHPKVSPVLKVCPCHQAMAHPQFTDGQDDHQLREVLRILPCKQYFLCD
jgi:hypothetical protein